jgi:hypothetical protein
MGKRAIVLLSLVGLGLSGMLGTAWGDGNGNTDHKVEVCKLVRTPDGQPGQGGAEEIKGGKQPIVVDSHALNGQGNFSDAQESLTGPCPQAPPGPQAPGAAPKAPGAAPKAPAAAAAAPVPARAPAVAAAPAAAPVQAAPRVTG